MDLISDKWTSPRDAHRPRGRLAAAALVLALFFGTGTAVAEGPGAAGDGKGQHLTLEPYAFEARGEERVDAELGRLVVEENRSSRESREIELVFVRLPATGEMPGPPIVYLAGGPGSSGIAAGRGARFRLFDDLRKLGDVILLDQRGAGMSTPIDPEECPIARRHPFDRPLELERHLEVVAEVAAACASYWSEAGVDLEAYDTLESVEDLEDLRLALGAETIRLLGISYGTHLGLAYMRRYPGRVSAAVLAGIEGPDDTVKLPSQFESQLEQLEALIARQRGTDAEPLRDLMRRVLDRLERQPVTLRIVQVAGPDRETQLVVGRREVAHVTMDLLRDPQTMIQVPVLYQSLDEGDFTDLAGTLLGLRTVGGLEAMPEAMDAASGISKQRLRRLEAEDAETLLGSGLLQANVVLSTALKVSDLGPDFRSPVRSDVPTLFISGSLDGRTPPGNALRTMEGFSAAQHLTVVNGGHGDDLLLATPELESAIGDFLSGRPVSSIQIELRPPDLTQVRRRVPLSPRQAALYVGEYERAPREIWRILHHVTVESLGSEGEILFSNATLQIRWGGNGFPFHPFSDTGFYIDFPWFLDVDFHVETDASGNVSYLVFEDAAGETVRMEKVH